MPKGIEIDVSVNSDTIFYSDAEKKPGECDCICEYNSSAIFSGIESGDYVLCFMSGGSRIGSIELYFKNDMYEYYCWIMFSLEQ